MLVVICDIAMTGTFPPACMESFYKDTIENTTCTPCPPFSDVSDTGSNALSNCTCTLSSGNAEQGCYGNNKYSNICLHV